MSGVQLVKRMDIAEGGYMKGRNGHTVLSRLDIWAESRVAGALPERVEVEAFSGRPSPRGTPSAYLNISPGDARVLGRALLRAAREAEAE